MLTIELWWLDAVWNTGETGDYGNGKRGNKQYGWVNKNFSVGTGKWLKTNYETLTCDTYRVDGWTDGLKNESNSNGP